MLLCLIGWTFTFWFCIAITFLTGTLVSWMEVTCTIFPFTCVTHMILREVSQSFCIFNWILEMFQATMVDASSFNEWIRKTATACLVPFTWTLCFQHLWKFSFVLLFNISGKLKKCLLQTVGMSPANMGSTFKNLSTEMVGGNRLGRTRVTILPHNLNRTAFIFSLFITFIRKNSFHGFWCPQVKIIFRDIVIAMHTFMPIPQKTSSHVIFDDKQAVFAKVSGCVPDTIRRTYCPLQASKSSSRMDFILSFSLLRISSSMSFRWG